MKGNRTVNTQKLMKKLLALPVLETMEGKRAVELSRVLEAVRASAIIEKDLPNEDKLTVRDVEAGVNLISSSAEKARITAGRNCSNCRYGRPPYTGKSTEVYCMTFIALCSTEYCCCLWERKINHE